MAHVIQILFNHQSGFHSAFVNIIHEFETDFIDIELLDEEMIEIFNASNLSYAGEGYRKLPVYKSAYIRPIFNKIRTIIKHAQNISNNEEGDKLLDEEYTRRN